MEIRLGTIQNKYPTESSTVAFEDEITIREFNALTKAIAEVNKYRSGQRLFEIVCANDQEIEFYFQNSFDQLLITSVSWAGVKPEDLDKIFLHANRLLLNYLSSIRTYLDHSLLFLSREYGKNSMQITKFKKLLSFNFDNNFPYRFFYKLRNFSQHCGVPICHISFTTKYDRKTEESYDTHGHLQALFDPKSLLESYDSWGQLITRDLTDMDKPFELRYLRMTMYHIMFNINHNFKKINRSKTKKAANYIFKKVAHLNSPEKEICIFYNLQTDENGHLKNFTNIEIPIKLVDEILSS